jgi:hypothetical protein
MNVAERLVTVGARSAWLRTRTGADDRGSQHFGIVSLFIFAAAPNDIGVRKSAVFWNTGITCIAASVKTHKYSI